MTTSKALTLAEIFDHDVDWDNRMETFYSECGTPSTKPLFPKGIWNEEPDFIIWREGKYGCAIIRNENLGHLCGYMAAMAPEQKILKTSAEMIFPGGITFEENKDGVLILGFDCAHFGDYMPFDGVIHNNVQLKTFNSASPIFPADGYKTVEFLRCKIEKVVLATQLNAYKAT